MQPIRYENHTLYLLDQTKLPHINVSVPCKNAADVATAIKNMVVRGAPAIGASAAYGMALEAIRLVEEEIDLEVIREKLKSAQELLASSRPTAVNLFWALKRMNALISSGNFLTSQHLAEALLQEAHAIMAEDVAVNKSLAAHGASVIPKGAGILTHCNTGSLATAGYGTALGVIRTVFASDKSIHVYACETRPYWQGARLTAYELMTEGIPMTLITDSMAGFVMQQKLVHAVIVGADRVTRNGDVANKIGTYSLAVLAKEHGIPFYVAVPKSTIDLSLSAGGEIEIEERPAEEITHFNGQAIAPLGVKVYNPSFDITPCKLITGLITEQGVIMPPYEERLNSLFER